MFICIWNQLSLIEWYWKIQHFIQMPKCEWTIDITINYNYQESIHIRFDSMIIIKLINPWFVTHWLAIEQMIDWLLDWLNGESNLISIPSQSDSIHSSSLLLLSSSPPFFLCCDLFLFNEAKSISYFNINDCIVLSIYWSMDSQMWMIINKYQSIRTIPLCHYQIQSSWLFEATSLLLLLNKSYFKPSFGYDW